MKTHLLLAAVLAGSFVLASCNRDGGMDSTADPAGSDTTALESPPGMTDAPADAPAEPQADAADVTVTDVLFGTEVDADERVTSPQTAFASDDETIHVSITTVSSADAPATATLGVRWTYEDGQLIDERSAALQFTGPDATSFHVNNPEGWPMGTYDVEVTLNGEPVETRQFTIQ